MRDLAFTNFQQITKLSKSRSVILFGAGVIAEKTMRNIREKISMIIDNNPNLWYTTQLSVDVKNPEIIESKIWNKNDYFIIICTTSFDDVSEQLIKYGLSAGRDFVVSPILNDLRIISELESVKTKLLFTSGLPAEDSPKYGGGIYLLSIDGDQWEYKKIYSGTSYGLIKYGKNFIAVDDNLGLIEFDKEYNIIRNAEFSLGTRAHGIAYSHEMKRFFVVASYMDRILIFDNKFKYIDHISISHKFDIENKPSHHCNDICVVGNSLYVSMFSKTGNFKRDIFDGVVLEIDIPTKKILGTVISDLWMPHNISFHNGCLTVLDSLRGGLRQNNAKEIGRFPGFTRGLDTDGVYYYIGQSRNRNYSKSFGISMNISIDTSIIIFDEHTKVSRSIQLPPKLSEIHSILVL